jgi:hypothetical protein
MAFAEIDDAIAGTLVKAKDHGLSAPLRPHCRAAACVWRRQMRRMDRRRFDPLGFQSIGDAIYNVACVSGITGVLQLASPANGKVAAWRRNMVLPRRDPTIGVDRVARHCKRNMPTIGGDALPTRRDADDLGQRHAARASARCASRSSAIRTGPARRAASPCSHTAAQAAS